MNFTWNANFIRKMSRIDYFSFVWYMSLGFLSLVQALKIRLSVRKRLPFALARTNKHQNSRSNGGVRDRGGCEKRTHSRKTVKIEKGVKAITFTKNFIYNIYLKFYPFFFITHSFKRKYTWKSSLKFLW